MYAQLLQTALALSALTSTAFAVPNPAPLDAANTFTFSCYWTGMRIDGPVFNSTMEEYCLKYATGLHLSTKTPDQPYSVSMDMGLVGTLRDPGNGVGTGVSITATSKSEAGIDWTQDTCRHFANKVWDACHTDADSTYGGKILMDATEFILDPRASNELKLNFPGNEHKLIGEATGTGPI